MIKGQQDILFKKTKDSVRDILTCEYNSISESYRNEIRLLFNEIDSLDLRSYPDTIAYFQKAMRICEETLPRDQLAIERDYWLEYFHEEVETESEETA